MATTSTNAVEDYRTTKVVTTILGGEVMYER